VEATRCPHPGRMRATWVSGREWDVKRSSRGSPDDLTNVVFPLFSANR
jgi:hypothetical protein